MDKLLEVFEVGKSFPHPEGGSLTVLKSVSFSVSDSGSIAIMGASGSGKSTLLNIIAGLDSPDKGNVLIKGNNIFSLKDKQLSSLRNKEIGYVFQFFNLISELNVWENIALPLIIAGEKKEAAKQRALAMLDGFEMKSKAYYDISRLSGGEMQRVAIMRSVICDPSIILADEPTGNLDSHTAKDVLSFLFKVAYQTSRVLITVTHSREIAKEFDRVFELKEGHLTEVYL